MKKKAKIKGRNRLMENKITDGKRKFNDSNVKSIKISLMVKRWTLESKELQY